MQGVFFRHSTKKVAIELGLTGWVRNLSDGRVEAVFEGEREMVEKMLEWVRVGPPLAHVENVNIKWEEFQDEFSNFSIKYD